MYKPTKAYKGKLPSKTVKKGSKGNDVRALQGFLNWCINAKLKVDGVCGDKTTAAIRKYQKAYGLKVDGIFGNASKTKAKKIIEKYKTTPATTTTKPTTTTTTPKPATQTSTDPLQKWYDAMKTQYDWSKNQAYKFVTPNIKSSKTKGTCITFPAVSLQRLGLLPKDKYFYYHPDHKRISGTGAGYVKKHTEIYSLSYPHKTIAALLKAGKIKKGDIIGFGNPYYHTMVFMGKNKNGDLIFNTMGHKRGIKTTYPLYAKRKVDMLVHLKKTGK